MNKHRPAALVFAALFALHLLIFAGALWARRPPVWLVLAALAALWLADFGAFHLALHLDPANLKLHRRACQICALAAICCCARHGRRLCRWGRCRSCFTSLLTAMPV